VPRIRVLRRELLEDGIPQRVEVPGQAILVVSLDGEVHAVSDTCPHNGASLSDGLVRDGCVTCPAHLWRFRLSDGARQGQEQVRLAVHSVEITDDGWVEVDVPSPAAPRSMREILLAHARGEMVD